MVLPITTDAFGLDVGGSTMEVRIARPSGDEPRPGVLVCHHREGVDDFTRYVLVRLAEIGLVAAAPNYYHRRPKDEDPVASMKYLDDRELLADSVAAVEHLRGMREVRPERIATVGHCLGGRTSFLAMAHVRAIGPAVLLYHGNIFEARAVGMTAPFALTRNLRGPILGLFGREDVNPSPEHVATLDAELIRQGIRHEFHSYDGTGHAFQDFHSLRNYRQPAADDAWKKLLSFLHRELLTS